MTDLGLIEKPYPITVNRANFNNSCFIPTFLNFTVAFVFSPLPSRRITIPMPKRSCLMMLFSLMPFAELELSLTVTPVLLPKDDAFGAATKPAGGFCCTDEVFAFMGDTFAGLDILPLDASYRRRKRSEKVSLMGLSS